MEDSQEQSQSAAAVALAAKFHRYYEELAPRFGYETREETRQWNAKTANGRLMAAVCEKVLADLCV